MAGFLRRKTKHEEAPTKQLAAPASNPTSAPTPLFARFATSVRDTNEPPLNPRVVSSPMLLSSNTRKENTLTGGINRGYASSSVSVVGRESKDLQRNVNQIQKPAIISNAHQSPFQYDEPVPPATRPTSVSQTFDKPLPSPFVPAANPSTSLLETRRAVNRGPPAVAQIKQPLRSRASLVVSSDKPLPVPIQQSRPTAPVSRAIVKDKPPVPNPGRKLSLQTTFPSPQSNKDINRSPVITNLLDDEFELTPETLTPRPSHYGLPRQLPSLTGTRTGMSSNRADPEPRQNGLMSPQLSDHGHNLPPEFALFQDFSAANSSPTNSVKSTRVLPAEKFTGQVPASSGGRSVITEDKPSITPQPSKYNLPSNINTATPTESFLPTPPIVAASPPATRSDMGNANSILNGHQHELYPSSIGGLQASRAFISPAPSNVIPQFGPLNPQPSFKRPMHTASPPLPPPPPGASPPFLPTSPRMNLERSPFAHQLQSNTTPNLRKSSSLQASSPPVQGRARIFAAMAAIENEANGGPSLQPFAPTPQQPVGYATRPLQEQLQQPQQPQFRPEFTYPKPNQNHPPFQNDYRLPPPSQPPLNASAPRPSFVSDQQLHFQPQQQQQQQQLYQQSGARVTRMNGNRPPTAQSNDRPSPIFPQSSPRTRKLSKPRQPSDVSMMLPNGSSTSVRSNSVESLHKVHQHGGHRTMAESHTLPPPPPPPPHQLTVLKVDQPAQLDGDNIRNSGIPLDEDPFARVEGVKMLKASTPPPKEGSIKRQRSKDPKGRSMSSECNTTGDTKLLTDDEGSASPRDDQQSDSAQTNASHTSHAPKSAEDKRREKKERKERERRRKEREEATEVPRTPVPSPQAELMPEEGEGEGEGEDPSVQKSFPLAQFLVNPQLLSILLSFSSFYDWCILSSVSKEIRILLVQSPQLREEVLERFLKTVGYSRWLWDDRQPLSLSLQDLSDYMRGVSTPSHEYARVAKMYVHSLSMHPTHRDPTLNEIVRSLTASARGYTRVVLRLRAQAEKEASLANPVPVRSPSSVAPSIMGRSNGYGNGPRVTPSRASSRAPSPTMSNYSHGHHGYQVGALQNTSQTNLGFRSPLFRLRRAPLLRVFVPSPEGDWLSDKSVLECEAECKRAGVVHLMRMGDVVWDVAVGDEGNVGRLVWDGSYLIDLDYTYNPIGDLPKYIPTLAFPPSYFHRVIRTGAAASNPIVHIDISPWGEEMAVNLQLLQDRVKTETPQGAHHNVVRWVHRSSFVIRPPARVMQRGPSVTSRAQPHTPRIPIPDTDNLFIDSGWYGTIVVETEGTNEALADLQDRCGPRAFPPRPRPMNTPSAKSQIENRNIFRILREKSRPGEIWVKAVGFKERLL